MRRLIIILISLLVASCATTEAYEKILNSWIGAEEIRLVRGWGPPLQTYETGGVRFLSYTSRRNVYISGTAPTYSTTVIGNTAYTTAAGGSPGYVSTRTCVTVFEVVNGRIARWSHKGNDCKALEK